MMKTREALVPRGRDRRPANGDPPSGSPTTTIERQTRQLRRLRLTLWNALLSHQRTIDAVTEQLSPLHRRDRELAAHLGRWRLSMQLAAEGKRGGRHTLLERRRALAERVVAVDACTEAGSKAVAATRRVLESSERTADAAHLHIVEFVWNELVALRNEMIEAHRGLVSLAMKRCRVPSQRREEVANEAVFALIRAMECFDPEAGTRFSTYAMYWLRAAVRRADVGVHRTIRAPQRRAGRLVAATDAARVEPAPNAGWMVVPFDEQDRAAFEFVPEVLLDERRQLDSLPRALQVLRPRDRWVLEQRYALTGGAGRSLQRIADELGLSRERVRQIQLRAQDQLRRGLTAA